jgi:hypothetical protein
MLMVGIHMDEEMTAKDSQTLEHAIPPKATQASLEANLANTSRKE